MILRASPIGCRTMEIDNNTAQMHKPLSKIEENPCKIDARKSNVKHTQNDANIEPTWRSQFIEHN